MNHNLSYHSFFKIPVEIENARPNPALIIPTGAPITVANDAIEILPVVTDETINDISKYSKEAIISVSLLLINSLSLISAISQYLISLVLFCLSCCRLLNGIAFNFGYMLGVS